MFRPLDDGRGIRVETSLYRSFVTTVSQLKMCEFLQEREGQRGRERERVGERGSEGGRMIEGERERV